MPSLIQQAATAYGYAPPIPPPPPPPPEQLPEDY